MSFGNVLKMWQSMSARGSLGKSLFSTLFCVKAPYFMTILPSVRELAPGLAVVSPKPAMLGGFRN